MPAILLLVVEMKHPLNVWVRNFLCTFVRRLKIKVLVITRKV